MKIFLGIAGLVVIAVVLSFFFGGEETEINEEPEAKKVETKALDEVRKIKPMGRSFLKQKPSEKKEISPEIVKRIVEDTKDKIREVQMAHFDDYYEKVTSGWDSSIADLFLQKLNLNQEDLTYYFELKNQFESKKMETFKEFHEAKFEEFGEGYRYDQTDDELKMNIEELKNEYAELLREKIGEDNYRQYQDSLADYNKKIIQNSEGRTGPRILVEF